MKKLLDFLRQDDRWHQLDIALTEAFEKVKGETRNIYSWVKYLRQRDLLNEKKHEQLSNELAGQKAVIAGLQMDMQMLKKELEIVKYARQSNQFSPNPDQVRTKYGLEGEPETKRPFDKKIIAISRPIKKEYIISQIEGLIDKNTYSTKQIETIIVREKMLCGRTAFYDYWKEIRLKKELSGQRNKLIDF